MYCSAVVFSRISQLSAGSQDGELLDSLAACCTPLSPVSFYTVTTSGGSSRSKLLEGREQLERAWIRSTTSELHLSSQAVGSRADTEPFAWAWLSRDVGSFLPGSERGSRRTATIHRTLEVAETDGLLRGLQELFSLLDAQSGYIHLSSDRVLALGEADFQTMIALRPEETLGPTGTFDPGGGRNSLHWKHPEDTNDRIRQLGQVRSLVGPRLRGTYWGTFVGREMVEELGGMQRVMREAPVHRVEAVGHSGLYLQLTRSPEPITAPAMKKGLLDLEHYLQPVLVPLPPYFAARENGK